MTNKEIAIKVKNLSKIYHLYDNPTNRIKEALHPFRKKYHKDFHALKDISFEVKRGETVGIIGLNGAGKSTLLKIITGVLTESSGSVEVNGRISSLLELGIGFNPELTGLENIYFYGALTGRQKKEMEDRVDEIIEFADIGEFIYQAVKTYSSGMFARLAFSLAVSINPEILIIDEALSVGDILFQAKSIAKMKNMMKKKETTLLFVSHDTAAIKSICQKAIYIDHGEVKLFSTSDIVVEKYFSDMVSRKQIIKTTDKDTSSSPNLEDDLFNKNIDFEKRASFQRIQNGKAEFSNIILLNQDGKQSTHFEYGEMVTLRMAFKSNTTIDEIGFGYHIRDSNGVDLVYSDNYIEDRLLINLNAGERHIIDWTFKLKLSEGNYNIASVLSIPIDLSTYTVDFCDFIPLSVQFTVLQREPYKLFARTHWNNEIEIRKIQKETDAIS